MSSNYRAAILFCLFLPISAFAHGVTWTTAWVFVFSPIAALILSIVLGVLLRRWLPIILGFASVAFWIAWFWVATQTTTEDVLFWIPIAAVHAQIAILLGWTIWVAIRRRHR